MIRQTQMELTPRTYKALTLTQPWASLIEAAAARPDLGKQYETRSWGTRYRGALLIHAAKGLSGIESDATEWDLHQLCMLPPFRVALLACGYEEARELPRGAIVARVELVEVWRVEWVLSLMLGGAPTARMLVSTTTGAIRPLPDEPERAFGDYANGRFVWEFADIRRITPPIPARGYQQIWQWTPPDGVTL